MGKKLLDIMRDKIRFKHYIMSTERVYIYWAKKYKLYHNKKHPKNMGKVEIEQFLTHLATESNVSPTTQNQAFNAILFSYLEIIEHFHARPKYSSPKSTRKKTYSSSFNYVSTYS